MAVFVVTQGSRETFNPAQRDVSSYFQAGLHPLYSSFISVETSVKGLSCKTDIRTHLGLF